jgi:hypothetical protein
MKVKQHIDMCSEVFTSSMVDAVFRLVNLYAELFLIKWTIWKCGLTESAFLI